IGLASTARAISRIVIAASPPRAYSVAAASPMRSRKSETSLSLSSRMASRTMYEYTVRNHGSRQGYGHCACWISWVVGLGDAVAADFNGAARHDDFDRTVERARLGRVAVADGAGIHRVAGIDAGRADIAQLRQPCAAVTGLRAQERTQPRKIRVGQIKRADGLLARAADKDGLSRMFDGHRRAARRHIDGAGLVEAVVRVTGPAQHDQRRAVAAAGGGNAGLAYENGKRIRTYGAFDDRAAHADGGDGTRNRVAALAGKRRTRHEAERAF